jgi:hypothetical protein
MEHIQKLQIKTIQVHCFLLGLNPSLLMFLISKCTYNTTHFVINLFSILDFLILKEIKIY